MINHGLEEGEIFHLLRDFQLERKTKKEEEKGEGRIK